jgi:hypothetical protein
LVRGDVLYVDSTLVEADASLESAGARALLAQLPSAAGFVEAVWRENAATPAGAAVAPDAGGAGAGAGGPAGRLPGGAARRRCPAGPAAPARRRPGGRP